MRTSAWPGSAGVLAIFGAVALQTASAAQEPTAPQEKNSQKQEPKFKTLYALEDEQRSADHRKAAWYDIDPGSDTRIAIKINVIAPDITKRAVAEQIRKIHLSLREIRIEAEVLWQMHGDAHHENQHVAIASDAQASAMIAAHTDQREKRLHVYIVELDVDLDGDGKPDPAVGVRLPSVDAPSADVDAILLDHEAVTEHLATLAHAVGHFVGVVSHKGKKATVAFRQDGAQMGCKACLKSLGASPAP